MKKILIIAAHPDDEIIGCSASVARLINKDYEAFTLILGEGITSRTEEEKETKEKLKELKRNAIQANKIIGVKEVFFEDLPDNKFDEIPLLTIIKSIERIKKKVKPSLVFTHFKNDLNIDHRRTFEAAITAFRPIENEKCKKIYSFPILSSTEWNYPISFSPDTFVNIKETIKFKLDALKLYKSEIREFPHPRSIKGVKISARYWGISVGLEYVEPFKTVRIIF